MRICANGSFNNLTKSKDQRVNPNIVEPLEQQLLRLLLGPQGHDVAESERPGGLHASLIRLYNSRGVLAAATLAMPVGQTPELGQGLSGVQKGSR